MRADLSCSHKKTRRRAGGLGKMQTKNYGCARIAARCL